MKKVNTDLPEFIFNSSITALIDELNDIKEDIEITWDSFGGSTAAGQKWIDYLNDRKEKTDARVAGIVASMGATALPFFSNVKGAIQSDVMLHRVAGGEASTHQHTNEFFFKALSKKINKDRFKEVSGYSLKEVFLPKDPTADRINVWLTGKEAGYIGLYDETFDLLDKAATIKPKINVDDLDYDLPEQIAIKYGFKTQIKNDMEIKDVTAHALKTGNVEVYNSIVDDAKKAEQRRVSAIMKYAQHDMDKANEMIKSGAELTPEDVEHFLERKYNKETVENIEQNSEGKMTPVRKPMTPGEKTDEENEKEEKKEALDELTDIVGLGKYNKEEK